jgi:predicted nucleic acid-binding protein
MRARKVILDTGPLVAFLNKNDLYHDWTVAQFGVISPPLLTCEAVLSEACFLLQRYENGVSNIMRLLNRQVLTISFQLDNELTAIKALLNKYKDLPMSLADACLVRMVERTTDSVILTLDKHFQIYRMNKRQTIPLIAPETA